jgi:hypothetical protein
LIVKGTRVLLIEAGPNRDADPNVRNPGLAAQAAEQAVSLLLSFFISIYFSILLMSCISTISIISPAEILLLATEEYLYIDYKF